MTKLELAFSEAAKLPPEEQDVLAKWILEEIANETRWSDLFAKSEDELSRLADEAMHEYRAGKTEKLSPDNL